MLAGLLILEFLPASIWAEDTSPLFPEENVQIPEQIPTAAVTPAEIQQQNAWLVATARSRSGRNSFAGYCGTWVNWQIHLLGIDTKKRNMNGNEIYDFYANMDVSPGGYDLTAYPGNRYGLKDALNAISENGTKDVYNILVGFQTTASEDGQKYGHACFIQAIIDGVVYYAESNVRYVAGYYRGEGWLIDCTIDEFVREYNTGTVLDGVIHFGQITYSNYCTSYPSFQYAMVTKDTTVYSQPCTEKVFSLARPVTRLAAGTIMEVTGLYRNTEGEYWYRIQQDGATAYVAAGDAETLQMRYDDVENIAIYSYNTVKQGKKQHMYGAFQSAYTRIKGANMQVFPAAEPNGEPVRSFSPDMDVRYFNVFRKDVRDGLSVHTLDMGSYLMKISLDVANYYVKDGMLVEHEETFHRWTAGFDVIGTVYDYPLVHFQGNGGVSTLDRLSIPAGRALEQLPEASRPGYRFLGWFTAPEGGEQVTGDLIIREDVTLHAHWEELPDARNGWVQTEEGWIYYQHGQVKPGWVITNGIRFYIRDNGEMAKGWAYIGGNLYHFNRIGAMQTGWILENQTRYYFEDDGKAACGWKDLPDGRYYFGPYGQMLVGWIEDDRHYYYLDGDGKMVTGSRELDGKSYLFSDSGSLLAERITNASQTYYVVYDHTNEEAFSQTDTVLLRG